MRSMGIASQAYVHPGTSSIIRTDINGGVKTAHVDFQTRSSAPTPLSEVATQLRAGKGLDVRA